MVIWLMFVYALNFPYFNKYLIDVGYDKKLNSNESGFIMALFLSFWLLCVMLQGVSVYMVSSFIINGGK